MNKYLLFAAALIGFTACQQPGKQSQQAGATTDSSQTAPAASSYFYIQLKGTVADQPVTMQLLKTGPNIYRGYYCYDKIGEPITLWGSPDSSSQQLTLYENTHGGEDITFRGKLDDAGNFSGTWRGEGTSYHFDLKPDFTGAIRFNVYFAKDSTPLLPNTKGSPVGEAAYSMVWPVAAANTSTADFIKKAITHNNPGPQDPQALIKRDIDSFFMSYRASTVGTDTAEITGDTTAPTWSWSAEGDMKIVWNHYPLLVLEYFSYDFTGGAHGNGGSTYQVLDLEKQKVLTVDDVFKGDYKTVLSRQLEQSFRKTYKVQNGESVKDMLLVDEILPNNNFILTNKGVVFSYTPYEIGPYALGQVNLFIPYEQIKEVLKENYDK
ncbi:DUF3298 and DUF4163 domain-containing protein [Chitinophaga agrisoli]|uniref:DUF3298 and DUF4163 domain-containing protein n=1 Tax=Chitinophaga agrisoli TaxID=2607653 RepID=A0A5B2VZ99_9BACT|nr:DUF3298 and DUF4163 domain-containing protein [Chitinophaga agrisoli]KAA2245153.1 DUF3298 and DUF4163 domain-containing protein [Chitinophaga agrisoli]